MPGYTQVDWKAAWAGQLQALVRRLIAAKGPRTAGGLGWQQWLLNELELGLRHLKIAPRRLAWLDEEGRFWLYGKD